MVVKRYLDGKDDVFESYSTYKKNSMQFLVNKRKEFGSNFIVAMGTIMVTKHVCY